MKNPYTKSLQPKLNKPWRNTIIWYRKADAQSLAADFWVLAENVRIECFELFHDKTWISEVHHFAPTTPDPFGDRSWGERSEQRLQR